MSKETGDALEAAIAAHLASEFEDSYMKDWIVVASGERLDDPDRTQYLCSSGDHVGMHSAMGLLHVGVVQLDKLYTDGD